MAISLITFANTTRDEMLSGLVQKITNESQFLKLLRFIPVDGFDYHYGEQTTLGSIAFRGLNENYSPDTGVVNPRVERLAVFGGMVSTDHQFVVKQGDVARASQIAAKIKKAGLFYDRAVLKADPAVDPRQFPGLNVRLTGPQLMTAGANGGPLTLDLLDALLDRVVGTNGQKFIVMNKGVRRVLKKLRQTAGIGTTAAEIGKGFDNYDGARIVLLDEDGDETPILSLNEQMGNNPATTSIYCICPGTETDGEYMQGLVNVKPVNQYESGMNGVMHVDVVESNLGIALFHGRSAARLAGITY